jgi:hypothetical protein
VKHSVAPSNELPGAKTRREEYVAALEARKQGQIHESIEALEALKGKVLNNEGVKVDDLRTSLDAIDNSHEESGIADKKREISNLIGELETALGELNRLATDISSLSDAGVKSQRANEITVVQNVDKFVTTKVRKEELIQQLGIASA